MIGSPAFRCRHRVREQPQLSYLYNIKQLLQHTSITIVAVKWFGSGTFTWHTTAKWDVPESETVGVKEGAASALSHSSCIMEKNSATVVRH